MFGNKKRGALPRRLQTTNLRNPEKCPKCGGTGWGKKCAHGKSGSHVTQTQRVTDRKGRTKIVAVSKCDGHKAACGACGGTGIKRR